MTPAMAALCVSEGYYDSMASSALLAEVDVADSGNTSVAVTTAMSLGRCR